MKNNSKFVTRILVILTTTQGLLCLRDVYLKVPDAAERGKKVEMKCLYDLERDVLYSVKWYRGDREFSRYSPRDVPPLKVFRIPGIDVVRKETDAERLTVIPVSALTAEGRYTCEVTADAPSFQTAQVHAHMYVVELPKNGPEMHGFKIRYKPGMKMNIQCISRESLPAANLSFYINSERAHSQHVLHRVDGTAPGKLMTAYSTIQFVLQKHHFVQGKIKIRCTAIIYSIYLQSLEKSSMEERLPTTSTSAPEFPRAKIYPRHHVKENNFNGRSPSPATASSIVSLIMLLLPNVLR